MSKTLTLKASLAVLLLGANLAIASKTEASAASNGAQRESYNDTIAERHENAKRFKVFTESYCRAAALSYPQKSQTAYHACHQAMYNLPLTEHIAEDVLMQISKEVSEAQ